MTSCSRTLTCFSFLLFAAAADASDVPPIQRVAAPGGGTCEYGAPEVPRSIQAMTGFRSATVTGRVDIVANSPPAAVVIEHSSGFTELDEAVLVAMRKIRCQSPAAKPQMFSALQTFVFNLDFAGGIPVTAESARLFAGLGRYFDGLHMPAEADAAYADAIRANPQYALTYSYRADLRERNGQLAEALADLDEAIRLDPQYAWALRQRAGLRLKMGDADGAEADRKLAMTLMPRVNENWTVGRLLFNAHDFKHAAASLRRAVRDRPDNAYPVIWSYVASMRADDAGRAADELNADIGRLDAKAWPYPVISHLQGRLSADALLAAARGADDAQRAERVCEANFYMAQKELIGQHEQAAQPLLEAARRDCPKTFIEYTAAVAALDRMSSAK
ncbi:energy transducer TonB family protein [Piscinibacter terrae]|uniref:Tetratricopeptide repeat protein n=1 Tax=Piscinibacter terrae TaxID=2496871 RepID=A0A3N7HLZ6_9BURK|nr:energy transducer TonB [Albitalea terrae]RQP23157.1 hypothetical protein DZC73_18755 [Albitalea terrae]